MKPRHPVPLNALRAFEAAARHLSFQAAATQLFVTPAAVSHQVKRLETWLGTRLFRRGHRAVALTPEGEALAVSLGELFARLDLALDRATATTTAALRISTMESFAAKWLAPRLHRFHRECPELRLRVETGDALAGVGRDGVDVALRYGPGGYRGVVAEKLMEAPVFPVCAPGLARGGGPPATVADLGQHTLLHDESADGRPGVPDWSAWLAAAGAPRVDPGKGPVFASIYLALEAAIAGHGIALGVGPLVAEDLRQGRLVRPFGPALGNAYAFWIVHREGAASDPAVAAFLAWLRKEAAAPPDMATALAD